MNPKERAIELMGIWIASVIDGMDEFVDEETKIRVLESCGKACAAFHGHLQIVADLKAKGSSVEDILTHMNREKMWCGDWIQEGDIISSICDACECPLVLADLVKLSPTFCYCSRGFAKSLFEEILGKPVSVELTKAIGRGDEFCHFRVDCH